MADGPSPFPKYRTWFFRGSGDAPGYRRVLNLWMLFHGAVGSGLAFLVDAPLKEAANSVLLPLAGTLIGLTFAWAGNANALLQTEEMEKLSQHHPGGFPEYVYVYQTAILTLLAVVVLWGLVGLGVADALLARADCLAHRGAKACLFTLSSLAVREAWHAVKGAHMMLMTRKALKDHKL